MTNMIQVGSNMIQVGSNMIQAGSNMIQVCSNVIQVGRQCLLDGDALAPWDGVGAIHYQFKAGLLVRT